ncbi:MAG: hypothetical protein LBQ41_02530 [Candidatus Ancillula sp.]|jgi:hypothetical protein|nr:hypothetical protein [Candidatus Ancillula sp.]
MQSFDTIERTIIPRIAGVRVDEVYSDDEADRIDLKLEVGVSEQKIQLGKPLKRAKVKAILLADCTIDWRNYFDKIGESSATVVDLFFDSGLNDILELGRRNGVRLDDLFSYSFESKVLRDNLPMFKNLKILTSNPKAPQKCRIEKVVEILEVICSIESELLLLMPTNLLSCSEICAIVDELEIITKLTPKGVADCSSIIKVSAVALESVKIVRAKNFESGLFSRSSRWRSRGVTRSAAKRILGVQVI